MKKLYFIGVLSAAMALAGCSKENPFSADAEGEGQVLKAALSMSTPDTDIMVTRADASQDLSDFQIAFIKENATVASANYRYGDMPDVVTIKAGSYKVTATLGEDREAEWENPYFTGESPYFEVKANEITSSIDPIECELRNIKATIAFDSSLANVMSADSYVEVKVGDNKGLNFTTAEANAGKAGYFRHTDETTLVATFHGKVNGSDIVETKSYDGIEKGRWYKLTFKLHQGAGGAGSGSVSGDVVVDASVDVDDVNRDINIGDDEPLDDSERPTEGGGDEPDPPTPGTAPQIVAITPGLVFDTPWHVTNDGSGYPACEFKIISSAEGGVQELTCDIISDDLTAEELSGIGLQSHLDLVNTGDLTGALSGLGFPVNQGGNKEVVFNISSTFMGMMGAFGNHLHQFKLYVKDANGECTKTVMIQF